MFYNDLKHYQHELVLVNLLVPKPIISIFASYLNSKSSIPHKSFISLSHSLERESERAKCLNSKLENICPFMITKFLVFLLRTVLLIIVIKGLGSSVQNKL